MEKTEFLKDFKIWDRDFEIKIIFDCFDGEEITDLMNETYNNFIIDKDRIFKDSYNEFKKYLEKEHKINDDFNIFSYIIPVVIYIKRTDDNNRVLGLICNYRYDMEHGLAAYIENEQVIKIGNQDIIL